MTNWKNRIAVVFLLGLEFSLTGGTAQAVTVTSPSTDVVNVTTSGSDIHYDGNSEAAGVFARIKDDSTIRSIQPMGGFPSNFSGLSLRWLGLLYAPYVHSDYPWHAEVVQTGSPIGAFDAWVDTAEWANGTRRQPFDARVTHIFFDEFPDVVLFDIESIRKDLRATSYAISFQTYGYQTNYNSMRFWNDDPDGIDIGYGAGYVDKLFESDPVNGISVGYTGAGFCVYYDTPLVKGLLISQKDGVNDWNANPPCGWVIKKNELWAATHCGTPGGYFASVPIIRMAEEINTVGATTRNQLLWFQGALSGELDTWDKIYNLDDAWNSPCAVSTVVDSASPAQVFLVEETGLARNFEIMVLPACYEHLNTTIPILRGPSTVMLHKDVEASEERFLGELPIRLETIDSYTYNIINDSTCTYSDAEIRLPLPPLSTETVLHGGMPYTLEVEENEAVYFADIDGGETTVTIETPTPTPTPTPPPASVSSWALY